MSEEELKQIEEEYESPYCEVCGTCGYIGCCGIRNFIEEHIKGKTNCKNEDIIINELIDLCDYRDEVFEENKQLKEELENDIDRYEDTISYQLGFDKGKEYMQQRIDKAIELLKNDYFEDGSGNNIDKVLEILGEKE